MLRLLKYELRKTLFSKLVLLGITAIAEVIFLIGFWSRQENTLTVGALLLFFIAISGIALMGLLSLITLHRDMNTKQGYMLFMTPNSCYRILGAKMIEYSLSLLIAAAFFFALGYLDFSLLLGKGTNQQILDMLNQVLSALNKQIRLDAPHLSAFVFSMIACWICTVTIACLADVICSSLLYGKKGSLVITFILFILLNYGLSKLLQLVPDSIGIIPVLVWQGVIALALAGVMYVVTARLMEKYLSV